MYIVIHSPPSVFKHQYLQYFILAFTGRVIQSKWEFMHLFTEGLMTSFLLSFAFVLMHHSTFPIRHLQNQMGLCKGSPQMREEMLTAPGSCIHLGDGFTEVSLEVKLSRSCKLRLNISGLDGRQNQFTWLLIVSLQSKIV